VLESVLVPVEVQVVQLEEDSDNKKVGLKIKILKVNRLQKIDSTEEKIMKTREVMIEVE
jgi:hypothetical protein